MANNYFTHGSYPATGAFGASAGLRSELDAITAGFDLLPTITGNGGKILAVNAGATALEAITTTGTGNGVRATSPTLVTPVLGVATVTSINKVAITAPATAATLTLADGSTLVTAGAFSQTLTATGATNVTMPTTGTLATRAGVETLTNKSFDLGNNTLTGTKAQFNAALTDGDFADQSEIQAQTYTAFTTAGTSTAYTLTPTPAITAYVAGQSFFVTFHVTTGANPTLTISGVATPPNLVKQNGNGTYSNIAADDIQANHRSKVTLLSATQALVEDLPSKRLAQVQSTQTGAVATGTTTLPADDTIPQQTEGDQYMTLAITPVNTASELVVTVIVNASNSVAQPVSAALFRDAAANAVAAVSQFQTTATGLVNLAFTYKATSGSTTTTTFKVRVGSTAAGTTTFNGQAGGRIFGGVFVSSIIIEEYLP